MYIPKSVLLLACTAALVSACASNSSINESQSSAEAVDGNGVVCTYEKKLGKLIKEKVCYSKRDREIIKESAEEIKRERQSKRI